MTDVRPISPAPLDDSSPLRELLRIAAPAVVGMVSFALMQFVDRLLCARLLGPEALTAAGNGGIASWIPGAIMMGLLGVINTFVSQNLGAGKPERGPAYAWAGIWISVAAWALFILPYALVFPHVFEWMRGSLGLDPVSDHVHRMELDYGRILLVGMVITLVARTLGHFFYGVHRPNVVMVATIAGNITNLAASYALIQFAKAGEWSPAALPPSTALATISEPVAQRALRGAAIGTILGLSIELIIPLVLFLSPALQRAYRTRDAWRPSLAHMKDILRLGWAGGVTFGSEMICWWIFMGGFVASFDKGAAHSTHGPAGWITHQYLMLSFMPAVGISIATTAVVGKCIGAGRHDLALARTWLALKLALAYMGVCALCFILLGPQMARVFMPEDVTPEQSQQIVQLARVMLIMAATFQLFDALGITISGALRGAGDTVWPGVANIVLSWTVIVGGGWVIIRVAPGLSSYGPWAMASLYIVILSVFLLLRFLSGKWKRIKVLGPDAGEAHQGGFPSIAGEPVPAGTTLSPLLDIPQEDAPRPPRPAPGGD